MDSGRTYLNLRFRPLPLSHFGKRKCLNCNFSMGLFISSINSYLCESTLTGATRGRSERCGRVGRHVIGSWQINQKLNIPFVKFQPALHSKCNRSSISPLFILLKYKSWKDEVFYFADFVDIVIVFFQPYTTLKLKNLSWYLNMKMNE